MATKLENNTGPIEVWLSQPHMKITCRVVFEDESTNQLDVESLSMRGAQREMTGWLIDRGYEPVGRWGIETDGETMRQFRRSALQRRIMEATFTSPLP
jgi:hypothetical protein